MQQVKIYPLSNSKYASQIYGGLFDLAHANKVKLKFSMRPAVNIYERRDWGSPLNNRLVYIELEDDVVGKIRICYDMLDGPEIISPIGLKNSDVYFKRSYSREFLTTVSDRWQKENPEWVQKIHPYGLYTSYATRHRWLALRQFIPYAITTKRNNRQPPNVLRYVINVALKGVRHTPELPEIPPSFPAESLVMFQTRLFVPELNHPAEETIELNEQRIAIVRALKKEFGKYFRGGIIPDAYASKRCPDILTSYPTQQREYYQLVKKCCIAVFSRGLRQSTGRRLPELFAMSRCIVSQPLAYELPEPIESGTNCIYFESPDECVEACEKLISSPALAKEMRSANWEYYDKSLRPASIVGKNLDVATSTVRSSYGLPLCGGK